MVEDVDILVAEDDSGHATLVKRNLKRAGLANDILHFQDGQAILDFLFRRGEGPMRVYNRGYVLLLDIKMPKVDGVEVLRQLKQDDELKKLPVIMVTTTNNPKEIDECYRLGCSHYITKPVDYDAFVETIQKLGLFLKIVQLPHLNGQE
ncbi:MAG: response regulator [Candidatus Latescibacteria bacterium]|jgi:CheY-like chemotaxis protein|nr:response regulator [Candidatus Latescibacterota bacterium]